MHKPKDEIKDSIYIYIKYIHININSVNIYRIFYSHIYHILSKNLVSFL